jgi:hypothetical protein
MHPSIPYIIALCVLIWFSHALTKIFQREVDPMRRRDLTLANAENAEAVEARFSFGGKFAFRVAIAILSALCCFGATGLVVTMSGDVLSENHFATGLAIGLLFGAVPMCHGTIALFAARACRLNRPLSSAAMLAGVLIPVGILIQFPILVGILAYLFEWDYADSLLGILLLFAAFGVGSISMMIPFLAFALLPIIGVKKFLKAYPYTE